jgi:hypothetical protein
MFFFYFIPFSMTKLFNIQSLLHHRSKHDGTKLLHPYSSKAFHQWYHNGTHYVLGDLNTTNNQTNKQPSKGVISIKFRIIFVIGNSIRIQQDQN